MTLWLIHKKGMSCGYRTCLNDLCAPDRSCEKYHKGPGRDYLAFLTDVTPSMLSSYVSPTFLRKAV